MDKRYLDARTNIKKTNYETRVCRLSHRINASGKREQRQMAVHQIEEVAKVGAGSTTAAIYGGDLLLAGGIIFAFFRTNAVVGCGGHGESSIA